MNCKFLFFENEYIKIDMRDSNISIISKESSRNIKEEIDFAFNVFKYINKTFDEINNELQPERLSEKTSKDDAIV